VKKVLFPPLKMALQEEIAIVTGSARGLGRGIAEAILVVSLLYAHINVLSFLFSNICRNLFSPYQFQWYLLL